MKKDVFRIARVGDIIKVVVSDGTEFVGRLSNIGQLIYDGSSYDYEFLISEIPSQSDSLFGAVLLQTSSIKSLSIINNYSAFKDTVQDEVLNIDKVKRLIEQYDISVSELASRMGKDRPSVSKILNRKRKDISLHTAVSLASALGVSVDEIVNR